MKLSFLFLFIGIGYLSANVVHSQDANVNMVIQQKTIAEVLKDVEKQTSYLFFYNEKDIDVKRTVTGSFSNTSVSNVLASIFSDTDVNYTLFKDYIVLTKNNINTKTEGIQPKRVSGVVTDASTGEPLAGVYVRIEGTQAGAITDTEGKFSVEIPDNNSDLSFSFVGYNSETISVGGKSVINVVLVPDIQSLEEVVVIGYGTMKKRDVIGSISTIQGSDITKIPLTSLAEGLQGMASGLMVTNNSGHPGNAPTIKIRGVNSINLSTNPLWVIDGVPVITGASEQTNDGVKAVSPISMLNPNDIESIQVLKDASATAIYGNRASAGVIIVTTKSYQGDNVKLSVSYDGGISQLPFSQNDVFVDSKTWFEMVDKSRTNAGLSEATPAMVFSNLFQGEQPEMTKEEALATNTDHLGAMTHKAMFHQIGLTASKGFQTGGMTFSLSYRDEEGLIRNNDFQRLTSRFNLRFKPLNSVEVAFTSNFVYMRSNGVRSEEGKGNGGYANWYRTLPWYKINDENSQTGYWALNSGYNLRAYSDRNLTRYDVDKYRGLNNASVKWDTPLKGLTIKGEGAVDLIITNNSFWRSALLDPVLPYYSSAFEKSVTNSVINLDVYANYVKTINDIHDFDITVGTESTRSRYYSRYASGNDIQSVYPELRNVGTMNSMYGNLGTGPNLMGIFARANYKLLDRYLINASYRRDGHSAFSEDNRWADFYAFGAGWILTDENFMKEISWLNLLKLRGSYGTTGNCNVSNAMTYMQWGTNTQYVFGADYLSNSTTVGPLGSSDLKWEVSANLDLGIDFGLLNNRINGSATYYVQNISDLILLGNVQPSVGYTTNSIYENVGDLKNWGFEFNIASLNINKNNFSWRTEFNISTNKNEVVSLNEAEKGKGYINGTTIRKEGEALNTWYLASYTSVDPERGVYMIKELDADTWNNEYETVTTGNIIPMTNNNVANNKLVQSGKTSLPKFYGGLSNTFRYKNFDLNVLLNFAGGHWLMNDLYLNTSQYLGFEFNIVKDMVGNTWENPGDAAKYPQLVSGNYYHYDDKGDYTASTVAYSSIGSTTRFLEKADFIRLKNLQLGYTLPNTVLNSAHISSLRIYAGVTNLFTITGYSGLDPETQNDLPIPRTIIFGLSLNL